MLDKNVFCDNINKKYTFNNLKHMEKSIILNKQTFTIEIGGFQSENEEKIISYEEIKSNLPGIIQNDSEIEPVSKVILLALKRLSGINLPMHGTGRIYLDFNLPTNEDVKKFLLSKFIPHEPFSVRLCSVMEEAGFRFIYELIVLENDDLLKFKKIGRKTINESVEEYQKNGITDEIQKKLKDKLHESKETKCKDVFILMENESFKELLLLLAPIEDLSQRKVSDFDYEKIYNEMFPYRHSGPTKDSIKTDYEKMFDTGKRKLISSLISKSRESIQSFYDNFYDVEMKKFIQNL
jgi:hypothetical protein